MTDWQILLAAYILGSIPFGLLLTRLAGLGDIRNIGSGNIGATNVLRTGRKALALCTVILDALKGTIAVLLAEYLQPDLMALAALCALLGHLYPIWLKFRGGKGVATALGIWLGLSPTIFAIMGIAWLLGAFITRRSSCGALAAVAASPVAAYFLHPEYFAVALVMMALITLRHRANIERIIKGTEPKIGEA
ncbi:MAG: glycerol-3-phosphate 1-O-acyltransferase PlsY [Bdellovibrionales bacterium]